MNRIQKNILIPVVLMIWLNTGWAEDISKDQIKGLDEQVQDIKKDVLGISAELTQLEEKLIYPSNTQVSVFVSVERGEKFRLDSVILKIDGKPVMQHVYTFKELEALQSGGVQRLYTGNIRAGEHSLEFSMKGKSSGSSDYQQNASFKFTKSVEPKLVEVILSGPASSQHIGFKD